MHLSPQFGDRRLHEITTEDVQQLKAAMASKSPKTVNDVLTVLSVMLSTAVEWNLLDDVPCAIELLKAPKTTAPFYDFEPYERLEWSTSTCRNGSSASRVPSGRGS